MNSERSRGSIFLDSTKSVGSALGAGYAVGDVSSQILSSFDKTASPHDYSLNMFHSVFPSLYGHFTKWADFTH